jgi:pimeloyl-ACP methyl ester carboxylesterase
MRKRLKPPRRLAVLILLCAMGGCKGESGAQGRIPEHVIRLNRDGLIIDAREASQGWPDNINLKPLDSTRARAAIAHILAQAESLGNVRNEFHGGKKRVKLMVYVHGGLNTFGDTDDRVDSAARIMSDTLDWHYPVFLSWPSNGPGAWAENTFRIREGRKTKSAWLGIATSPFLIISDILGFVANYPSILYFQIANEKDRMVSVARGEERKRAPFLRDLQSTIWSDADAKYCSYALRDSEAMKSATYWKVCGYGPVPVGDHIVANRSQAHKGGLRTYFRAGVSVVTSPFRFTLGTLYHGTIGVSAWDNMKRRTRNVFLPPFLFDSHERGRGNVGMPGGDFFPMLLDHIRKDRQHIWEVTLVGHSMGTIVLNQTLTMHQKQWLESGALTDIVYMAAASTIEDGIGAVTPILRGLPDADSSGNAPPAPTFYNLTLNRIAEVAETHWYGFVPTGSLLVSIDQHYEKPNHAFGRTLGSEVNVASALDVIAEEMRGIRGRAVFKSFDRHPGSAPEAHGEFNDIKFWKREVWDLPAPGPAVKR